MSTPSSTSTTSLELLIVEEYERLKSINDYLLAIKSKVIEYLNTTYNLSIMENSVYLANIADTSNPYYTTEVPISSGYQLTNLTNTLLVNVFLSGTQSFALQVINMPSV